MTSYQLPYGVELVVFAYIYVTEPPWVRRFRNQLITLLSPKLRS